MSAEDAAWLGFGLVVLLLGARWLGHFLLCDCSASRRGRTSDPTPPKTRAAS